MCNNNIQVYLNGYKSSNHQIIKLSNHHQYQYITYSSHVSNKSTYKIVVYTNLKFEKRLKRVLFKYSNH